MSAAGYEPALNRSRLAAAANRADVLTEQCRLHDVADAGALWQLCRAAGVSDPRDLPSAA